MFKKILIANRGEIALRVIRACKEMGIATVAIYSKVDEHSLHVKLADESVCVGPAPAKLSYLNVAAIMSAADLTGADAIHPGYGFLAENADFARVCEQCGIAFIGPAPDQIAKMGDKAVARKIAREAGVPMLPGSGILADASEAEKKAEEIGYPVMLKATAGGGGRGIQIIYHRAQMRNAFERTRAEAAAAFGLGDCYLEKFCEHPRHVEIQVVCDAHGNCVHLGERDCTVQRRHQKVIEESPSPAVDAKLRASMGESALQLCRRVGYTNVGTVEFLLDESKNHYFMEMNTRIQVEHPVTEMVTGRDLIKEQIRIAAGEKVSFTQEEVTFTGHAIECRINAEDPERMAPSPGLITAYHPPGGFGVRVDSFVYQQYTVLPFYDSMIGKIICHARTREEAIQKMTGALSECVIAGIRTNMTFQRKILLDPRFKTAQYDTRFLEQFIPKFD
ncbi:MAG: acetyl-CoA carboxylase biotin carboxylase subunit [Deltaproteobacteria bacterium]|nr:acetyl-CoA carboxylase biotin carboxylase subunit [Deltaproteobacteria bacterium]